MSKYRVLIWPSTTELGREAVRALRDDKDVEVAVAAQDIDQHNRAGCPASWLPPVSEDSWKDELQVLCKEEGVTHILPCHDAVLQALAKLYQSSPEEEDPLQGVVVLMPQTSTVLDCLSKWNTYQELRGIVEVPRYMQYVGSAKASAVIDDTERISLETTGLFVKPNAGNASRGCSIVHESRELSEALYRAHQASRDGAAVLCEYLPGKEYTVDCFSDRDPARGYEGLLWARARERVEARGGISWITRRVPTGDRYQTQLQAWAQEIGRALKMRGAWFFQVKLRADGSPVLMEVAPRFAGGAALARANGVNLPLLALYESLRLPLTIADRDDVPELRTSLRREYVQGFEWDALYIDLDDTLVCKGRVNPRLLALCAQARNVGKGVHVLTRDGGSYRALPSLQKHLLESFVGHALTYIPNGYTKANYISTLDRPVFVDDSFREREDVRARLGIPVFDAAGAECLLEDL